MKFAVAFLFLSTGVSIGADDEASKKLLKELEGTYAVVSMDDGGEAVPLEFLRVGNLVIKDGKVSIIMKEDGKEVRQKMSTIKVDAAKKPAEIDVVVEEGPEKGKVIPGIITIDGDTVKICCSQHKQKPTRPTEFKSTAKDDTTLMVLKKIKE